MSGPTHRQLKICGNICASLYSCGPAGSFVVKAPHADITSSQHHLAPLYYRVLSYWDVHKEGKGEQEGTGWKGRGEAEERRGQGRGKDTFKLLGCGMNSCLQLSVLLLISIPSLL